MPDIIRDGSDCNLLLWLDELCRTCDVESDCPLILAIKDLDLTTYGGCHVAECNRYVGEPTMTLETSAEDAVPINLATLQQVLVKHYVELQAVSDSLRGVTDS